MNNRILFLVLVIGILSILDAKGQTRFKEYVLVNIFEKPLSSSTEGIVKQEQFSILFKYTINKFDIRDKKEYLRLKKGQLHITETQKTIKEVTHTIKTDSIVTSDTTLVITSKEKYSTPAYIKPGSYRANLHPSNDTLYINFWLDVKNNVSYYDANKPEITEFLFLPTETYFITLQNRQSVRFTGKNWEVAALTIPFRLHFGYSNSIDTVAASLNTDVNISAFFGRRITRRNYRYESHRGILENKFSFSHGLTLGLSSTNIDSTNTIGLSPKNDIEEITVPIFTLGYGLMMNISDFNLGVFGGYDFGIGKNAAKWNFHQRPWFGFGFGYKLALFTKME